MSSHIIYGLIDPITKYLRYIGYTSNQNKRYGQHLKPALLKIKTHKNDWIKSLLNQNMKPEMIVLEIYDTANELPQAEIEMIEYYKYIGCDLVNGTSGGEGGAPMTGKKHSEHTKLLISQSSSIRKHSIETKERMSKIKKGKAPYIMTDDIRQNMSKSQKINGNPNSKLSYIIASQIREEYKTIKSYAKLATTYNVQRSAIAKIVTNKTWKIKYHEEDVVREEY